MPDILKSLPRHVLPHNWSKIRRQSARNASLSLMDYLSTPLLYLFSTPFLVYHLGVEHYGIWLLANSVVGLAGAVNLGVPEATVKYVSFYDGSGDRLGMTTCIRSTLALYLVLSTALTVGLVVAAPVLVERVFKVSPADTSLATLVIQLAAIGLGLRAVGSVFLSAIRGLQRYDISGAISIATSVSSISLSVLLAALGASLDTIILGTILVVAASMIASTAMAKLLIPSLSVIPIYDRIALGQILSFGIFSWMQGMAAVIFTQADRLLIASIAGPAALAYYSVALQVAQQTHGIVGSALNFLFPMISAGSHGKREPQLKRVYNKALLFSLVLSLTIALPLFVWGQALIGLWMGNVFASNTFPSLQILVIAYLILATSVAPHFTLLGLGEIRFVSLTNVTGGVLTLVGLFLLTPIFGVTGAAIARLFYAPVVTFNFVRLRRWL